MTDAQSLVARLRIDAAVVEARHPGITSLYSEAADLIDPLTAALAAETARADKAEEQFEYFARLAAEQHEQDEAAIDRLTAARDSWEEEANEFRVQRDIADASYDRLTAALAAETERADAEEAAKADWCKRWHELLNAGYEQKAARDRAEAALLDAYAMIRAQNHDGRLTPALERIDAALTPSPKETT